MPLTNAVRLELSLNSQTDRRLKGLPASKKQSKDVVSGSGASRLSGRCLPRMSRPSLPFQVQAVPVGIVVVEIRIVA